MKTHAALLALSLGSVASAQLSKKCQDNVCYSLNIPQNTGSDGAIFFQLTAPTSMQWIALGQGKDMSGANIFVVYGDANGKNVTLSPRLGKGEFEPKANNDADVTLLEGSGISNGRMVANVRCDSCNKWSGGSQDFTSSLGNWIYAYKGGDSIASNSISADIDQHDQRGQIDFDFSAAKGGSSINPLVASTDSSSGGSDNGSGSGTSTSGDTGDTSGFSQSGLSPSKESTLQQAHGILASLAFVVFWPIGAILVRVLSFSGLVWLHAAIQAFAWLLFIAAFGIGVYLANNLDELGEYHPVIGIVLFCLVAFQPILGMIHHRMYVKHQRRTLWSHAHIWLGRIVITLGIINGGLGLMLADNTTGGEIAYGVVAGVIWLAYVAAIVYGETKRTKAPAAGAYDDKARGESPLQS